MGEAESLPEEVPESLKLLFEEWLDELTEEARRALARNPDLSTEELARSLHLPPEGVKYILTRLEHR